MGTVRKEIVKRSKLLIVDDQEANIGLLTSILKEQGFIGIQSLTDARLVLPLFLDFLPTSSCWTYGCPTSTAFLC